jgi:Helix-turn-helix domain
MLHETIANRLDDLFSGRLYVDFAEASKILDIDQKTLRRHARAGTLSFVEIGHGTERKRRRFTCEDLAGFVAARHRRRRRGRTKAFSSSSPGENAKPRNGRFAASRSVIKRSDDESDRQRAGANRTGSNICNPIGSRR